MFASPAPPAGRSVRLTDVDHLAELFTAWDGRFDQITGGRFEAVLQVVHVGALRTLVVQANQRVRIRGHDADGWFMLHPVTAGSASSLWQGRQLAIGQVVLNGPENEVDHTSQRLTTQRSISFRPAELEDAVRALFNTDVAGLPRQWAALTPPPAGLTRLTRLLSRVEEVGVSTPALLRLPEGRQLEQECVRAVARLLTAEDTVRPDLSPPTRHRLVLAAEEVMRAHFADPVGAVDLCRRLRVSDRTLRLAFRERFGLGPMGYYKRLRLNAARDALKADPQVAVATAAVAFGFHHLGNFAADYRRLFGERPSNTRR